MAADPHPSETPPPASRVENRPDTRPDAPETRPGTRPEATRDARPETAPDPQPEPPAAQVAATLATVGARLKAFRREHRLTLGDLAAATGISVSTLSRLESGQRKPTLELLLPLALRYQVPLDRLVGMPPLGDPRVRAEPLRRNDVTAIPLTREPGGLRAYKLIIPVRAAGPEPRVHEGWEWMYVLSGRLRLVLGTHDIVLKAGEATEFDTHVPHWFGSAGPGECEVLTLFGPQGERMHVRARSRGAASQ